VSNIQVNSRKFSSFKSDYDGAAAERALQKIVPKPLDPEATAQLCELLKAPPAGEEAFLIDLLTNRYIYLYLIYIYT
jgi:aconitase B